MKVTFKGSPEKVRRQMAEFLGLEIASRASVSPPLDPPPERVSEATGRVDMQAYENSPAPSFNPGSYTETRILNDLDREVLGRQSAAPAGNAPPQKSGALACPFCGTSCVNTKGLGVHKTYCAKNPDRKVHWREKRARENESAASRLLRSENNNSDESELLSDEKPLDPESMSLPAGITPTLTGLSLSDLDMMTDDLEG